MFTLALPILYHSVDISYHHDNRLWPGRYPHILVPSDNPQRSSWMEDVELFRRQKCFIHTLLERPTCGKLVKNLTWSNMDWPSGPEEIDTFDEESMWQALTSLSSLRTVDFCSLACERETCSVPPLFSSATGLTLCGQMSYDLATSIMHSVDLSKLTFLSLDNIHDLGQIRKGKSIPFDRELIHLRESRYADGSPKTKHPGPMRDHLRSLTGKCTALKHLVLRSVGQDFYIDTLWSTELDEQRYDEWANFIDAARYTLRVLEIEQGLPPENMNSSRCPSGLLRISPQTVRPMDRRLLHHILPILVKQPWPSLKSMSVKGLGGRVQMANYFGTVLGGECDLDSVEAQLQQALGPHVHVSCKREATKTFFIRAQGFTYNM